MKIQNLHRALVTLIAATLFIGTASAKIIRNYNETIDLDGIESVDIHISAGNINIVGSDRSDLQFDLETVFKTNSESDADEAEENVIRSIKRDGNRLIIEVKHESKHGWWWNGDSNRNAIHFNAELILPADIIAIAHTNGGNVDAKRMTNRIDIKTNGGNIKVVESEGEIRAHTNGGNIHAESISGNGNLHTNGGNIRLRASNATIVAHTNGGNISADFNDGIDNNSRLTTNGGSITARLPDNYGFELLAQASGGRIRYDYNGTLQGVIENRKIDAKINQGGPRLHLNTSGGSVTVSNL